MLMSVDPTKKNYNSSPKEYLEAKRKEIEAKASKVYETSKIEDKPADPVAVAKKVAGAVGKGIAEAAAATGKAFADVQQSIINEAGPKKRNAEKSNRNRGSIGG